MKYFTSNIILYIEMSIVNLNIIFVKKQKRTRKSPTQGRGATSIITEMAVFTLETPITRVRRVIRLMIRVR